MGQPNKDRLREWHGAQLSVLVVRLPYVCHKVTVITAHVLPFLRICLGRLNVFQESDRVALVTRVFWRYVVDLLFQGSTSLNDQGISKSCGHSSRPIGWSLQALTVYGGWTTTISYHFYLVPRN